LGIQVTITKIARDRPNLLDLADLSDLEGGALHVAAMHSNDSAFNTLLDLKASPDARSSSGHTPMHSETR
jgi:ankyrin repeat protein